MPAELFITGETQLLGGKNRDPLKLYAHSNVAHSSNAYSTAHHFLFRSCTTIIQRCCVELLQQYLHLRAYLAQVTFKYQLIKIFVQHNSVILFQERFHVILEAIELKRYHIINNPCTLGLSASFASALHTFLYLLL